MVARPILRASGSLALLALGLTVGWSPWPVLAQTQDQGRKSGGVLLEFPNFGPIPGSTEPSMGAGPGALQPGVLEPDTNLIGGRRRVGRIPRTGRGKPGQPRVGDLPDARVTFACGFAGASGGDLSLLAGRLGNGRG